MGQVVQTLCKEPGKGNEEVTEKYGGGGERLCAYDLTTGKDSTVRCWVLRDCFGDPPPKFH